MVVVGGGGGGNTRRNPYVRFYCVMKIYKWYREQFNEREEKPTSVYDKREERTQKKLIKKKERKLMIQNTYHWMLKVRGEDIDKERKGPGKKN